MNYYLWKTSWASLASVVYSFHRGYYNHTLFTTLVLLTSLKYWSNPSHQYYRMLDIIAVYSAILYHLYSVRNSQYCLQYWSAIFITVMFYPLSIYYEEKNTSLSDYFHSCTHIGGNIANVILYSGEI